MITQEQIDQIHEATDNAFSSEVVAAAVGVFGDEAENALQSGAYCGQYASEAAFARDYVEHMDMVNDFAARYFDYEAFARDLQQSGEFVIVDGHAFRTEY